MHAASASSPSHRESFGGLDELGFNRLSSVIGLAHRRAEEILEHVQDDDALLDDAHASVVGGRLQRRQ